MKSKAIIILLAAILVMSAAIIGAAAEEEPINVSIENPDIKDQDAIANEGTVYWSLEPDSITLYIPPGESSDIVVTITNYPTSTEDWMWTGASFGGWYGAYGDFDFKPPATIPPGNSWTGPIGTFHVYSTTSVGTVCTGPGCRECVSPVNGVPVSDCVYVTVIAENILWIRINDRLDALITNVSNATMPNIIKQRLIDKLEYAKALKDNAHEECEVGNFDAATKKLGVAKNQVESFASMVRITRRISAVDKASFLADATEIIGNIDRLIEHIETEHKC